MAQPLWHEHASAKAQFQQASALLGYDLAEVMFHGTAEQLTATAVTQPAIFVHSVLVAQVQGRRAQPAYMAGHSLGEFSALVAAGALSFEEGLTLVAARAQAMQAACDAQPSTMAAIVGLDDAVVEAICAQLTGVVPANYNSPGQLVISGTLEGVDAALVEAKARGAKLAKRLAVGGAFHSPLMEPARLRLAQAIEQAHWQPPSCPIVQNADALPHTNIPELKANLVAQLTAPVRWTQSVQMMGAQGVTHFLELGPGKVLQGLIKRILPDAQVAGHEA